MGTEGMPPLWNHQSEAIEKAKVVRDLALFFDPGTGKTRTTVEILRHHYNTRRSVLPTLIFCPPVVIPNWKSEFLKYSSIQTSKIILLTGHREERVKKYLECADRRAIFVTNYEALQMKELFEVFRKHPPKIIVYDESHRLKNPAAIRSKKAWELSKLAEHRYILTGTPVLNSQMDLFSQFKALDTGDAFGHNFYHFRAQYFWDKNAGMPKQKYFPMWVARNDTNERFQKILTTKAVSVKKSECLDLPPLVRKEIDVEMGPEQARLYQEMKRDFITFLNDSACVAQLALTKALRLQQIVSGFLKTEDGKEHSFEENPRLQALYGVLEDLVPHHKVVVWAVFRENYTQIARVCEKLGVKYVQLTGETSDKDRGAAIENFRNDDSVRVFISNPGAGGVGVDGLQISPYAIFYSRTFSLEHSLQAEARTNRGGSEIHDRLFRIDLVTRKTIDEIILKALSDKLDLAAKILELKNSL